MLNILVRRHFVQKLLSRHTHRQTQQTDCLPGPQKWSVIF